MAHQDVPHVMGLPLHYASYLHQYHDYRCHVQNSLYTTLRFVHLVIDGIEYIDLL